MAEYSWLCEDIETLMTYTKDGYTKAVLNQAVNAIRKLSADVAPVQHGRWQTTGAYPHNVYCSECHKRFAQTHWAVWEDGSLPRAYCPNCGATMDGGVE